MQHLEGELRSEHPVTSGEMQSESKDPDAVDIMARFKELGSEEVFRGIKESPAYPRFQRKARALRRQLIIDLRALQQSEQNEQQN